MFRTLLALALATCAFAQKKPVTIEAAASPTGGGGRGDRSEAPIWSPDGTRFAYTEDRKLMLYDAASGARRALGHLVYQVQHTGAARG